MPCATHCTYRDGGEHTYTCTYPLDKIPCEQRIAALEAKLAKARAESEQRGALLREWASYRRYHCDVEVDGQCVWRHPDTDEPHEACLIVRTRAALGDGAA